MWKIIPIQLFGNRINIIEMCVSSLRKFTNNKQKTKYIASVEDWTWTTAWTNLIPPATKVHKINPIEYNDKFYFVNA